ncbi:MAG: hypothetical protein OSA99_21075 [Acidimicrobiales bacterium]|nr:hypothetical protein [Acidimicrobiales bacterium]
MSSANPETNRTSGVLVLLALASVIGSVFTNIAGRLGSRGWLYASIGLAVSGAVLLAIAVRASRGDGPRPPRDDSRYVTPPP